jgi:hypothetical protein
MNYTDIKQEILEAWDEIDGIDGRWMNEAVDSALPTYYSDIIEQWTKMPSEYTDRWQELVAAIHNHSLTGLMTMDLYIYLSDQYREAYAEIQAEKEEQEND